MIGSSHTYFPRNWRMITWVSNYRYAILLFVIGYPCDLYVNYAHFFHVVLCLDIYLPLSYCFVKKIPLSWRDGSMVE